MQKSQKEPNANVSNKNTISEMKKSLNGIKSKLDTAEKDSNI